MTLRVFEITSRERMTDPTEYIRQMPKIELHVHLEGSVRPETLLKLAKRHNISLPAEDVEGLRRWYTFRDFNHFVEIYMAISSCLRSAEDIELIAREFLAGQAEQNIVYSEVTFTPYNQYFNCGLGFREQLDAVNRARAWGEKELGVRMGMIIDIPREHPAEAGTKVADWVIGSYGNGIIAMGLGGPEQGNPPSKFRRAFERAREAGIPCILHAGETDGPASIWNAIEVADTRRIGHGVRAIEDSRLMDHLRQTQTALEVCPTSNVCLGVYSSLSAHSLPKLLAHGLRITINSDDPPMINTTLSREYLDCSRAFGWGGAMLQLLVQNALEVALLSTSERTLLGDRFRRDFSRLGS
jgi:adenosine deaminase